MTWDTENSVNIFGQVHLLNTRRAAVFLLQGESAYNSSVVGWGGHLPGGGVKASVKEVLDSVRINTPEEVRLMIRTSSRCHRGKNFLLERWGCQLGCGSFQRGERKLALIWSCQVIQFG